MDSTLWHRDANRTPSSLSTRDPFGKTLVSSTVRRRKGQQYTPSQSRLMSTEFMTGYSTINERAELPQVMEGEEEERGSRHRRSSSFFLPSPSKLPHFSALTPRLQPFQSVMSTWSRHDYQQGHTTDHLEMMPTDHPAEEHEAADSAFVPREDSTHTGTSSQWTHAEAGKEDEPGAVKVEPPVRMKVNVVSASKIRTTEEDVMPELDTHQVNYRWYEKKAIVARDQIHSIVRTARWITVFAMFLTLSWPLIVVLNYEYQITLKFSDNFCEGMDMQPSPNCTEHGGYTWLQWIDVYYEGCGLTKINSRMPNYPVTTIYATTFGKLKVNQWYVVANPSFSGRLAGLPKNGVYSYYTNTTVWTKSDLAAVAKTANALYMIACLDPNPIDMPAGQTVSTSYIMMHCTDLATYCGAICGLLDIGMPACREDNHINLESKYFRIGTKKTFIIERQRTNHTSTDTDDFNYENKTYWNGTAVTSVPTWYSRELESSSVLVSKTTTVTTVVNETNCTCTDDETHYIRPGNYSVFYDKVTKLDFTQGQRSTLDWLDWTYLVYYCIRDIIEVIVVALVLVGSPGKYALRSIKFFQGGLVHRRQRLKYFMEKSDLVKLAIITPRVGEMVDIMGPNMQASFRALRYIHEQVEFSQQSNLSLEVMIIDESRTTSKSEEFFAGMCAGTGTVPPPRSDVAIEPQVPRRMTTLKLISRGDSLGSSIITQARLIRRWWPLTPRPASTSEDFFGFGETYQLKPGDEVFCLFDGEPKDNPYLAAQKKKQQLEDMKNPNRGAVGALNVQQQNPDNLYVGVIQDQDGTNLFMVQPVDASSGVGIGPAKRVHRTAIRKVLEHQGKGGAIAFALRFIHNELLAQGANGGRMLTLILDARHGITQAEVIWPLVLSAWMDDDGEFDAEIAYHQLAHGVEVDAAGNFMDQTNGFWFRILCPVLAAGDVMTSSGSGNAMMLSIGDSDQLDSLAERFADTSNTEDFQVSMEDLVEEDHVGTAFSYCPVTMSKAKPTQIATWQRWIGSNRTSIRIGASALRVAAIRGTLLTLVIAFLMLLPCFLYHYQLVDTAIAITLQVLTSCIIVSLFFRDLRMIRKMCIFVNVATTDWNPILNMIGGVLLFMMPTLSRLAGHVPLQLAGDTFPVLLFVQRAFMELARSGVYICITAVEYIRNQYLKEKGLLATISGLEQMDNNNQRKVPSSMIDHSMGVHFMDNFQTKAKISLLFGLGATSWYRSFVETVAYKYFKVHCGCWTPNAGSGGAYVIIFMQIGFIVTNMIIAGIFSGGTINLSFLDRLLTFWLEMGVTYMLVSELKAFEIIFKAKTAEIHLWMVYFILVAITVYLYPFINGSE